MSNFLLFLVNTPKASISALIVAIAQIIKLIGISAIEEKTLNDIADAVSVIFGFIGLYFAGKGQWPTSPPADPPKP